MSITQTVEIPVNRRLIIDVPQDVPTGTVVLTFTPVADTENECPECTKHRDPKTGELRFNAETIAGMQEVEDMISGKKPAKWYSSIAEMMTDLDN